jgi:hypothetical protein
MDWATSFFLVSLSYLLYKGTFRVLEWQQQRSESSLLKEKIKLLEKRVENLETLSLGENLSDWYAQEYTDLYKELNKLESKKGKESLVPWEDKGERIRKKIKKIIKKKN